MSLCETKNQALRLLHKLGWVDFQIRDAVYDLRWRFPVFKLTDHITYHEKKKKTLQFQHVPLGVFGTHAATV